MKIIQKLRTFCYINDAIISYGKENGIVNVMLNYGKGFIHFVIKGHKVKVCVQRY